MPEFRETYDGPPPSDTIPAGTYEAEIVASEILSPPNGWQFLKLSWRVLGPTHAGRLVFHTITIDGPLGHPSRDESARIGREQRHRLFHALGKTGISRTEELHGIPCAVKVGVKVDKSGQYPDQNTIFGFPKGTPGGAQAAPQPRPQAQGWPRPQSASQGPPPGHPAAAPPVDDDVPW
jgi:hypothetical protein